MKSSGTLLLRKQCNFCRGWLSPHLLNQSRSVGSTLISGNKRGCSWCLVMARGRVSLSTESTIEYIIVACTIGLIVKVSRIWLAYG